MHCYKNILFSICLLITSPTFAISSTDMQRLGSIISDVKKYYYKRVDDKTLFDGAISGMIAGLDPHSEYLTAGALKELQMETTGQFGGIGIEVAPDQGVIKVVSPLDDTPAYRAGIKAGDYIIKIDNQLVRDLDLHAAVNLMRGQRGSKLTLTILRKNINKPIVVNLRRETINIHTVKSKLLESVYGYIRLAIFQDPTEKDLRHAIKSLQKDSRGNLKGIVLDIRNNPGGLLESAIQVADDFLDADKFKDNKLIVYTKGQNEDTQVEAKATPGELLPGIPMVVLINEGSASAAEIVAGSLQDHKRAIIVGTKSFGKGSVQTLIPIDKDSAIKLTTALYYTPLGRSIQAKGIEPDISIDAIKIQPIKEDAQNLPTIDEATLIDHIQNVDGDDTSSINKMPSSSEHEIAYKDYQLYEALHILKSMNVIKHKD